MRLRFQFLFLFFDAGHFLIAQGIFITVLRIILAGKVLHQPGGYDTTDDSARETDERSCEIALSHHKDDDQNSHAECRSKVDKRNVLVFLETV